MDWRKLLNYDLRQWLPGYRTLPPPRDHDMEQALEHYPASARKKIRDPQWKGPKYLNPIQWRVDLLFILEQVRLSARAGLPLHQGLDAAARNAFTTLRARGPGFRTRTMIGAVLGIAAFAAVLLAPAFVLGRAVDAVTLVALLGGAGALGIADTAQSRARRAAVCGSLVQSLNRGLTLSEAMARLDRFFPRPIVSVIEAGEATGRLAESAESITSETIERLLRSQEISGWLSYICMMFIVQAGIAGFMLVNVVPVLVEIKQEIAASMPEGTSVSVTEEVLGVLPVPSIEALGNASTGMYMNLAAAAAVFAAVGLGYGWRVLAQRRGWTQWSGTALDPWIPVYRKVLALKNVGTGATLLAQLLRAGIPLDRALDAVCDAGLHPVYGRWFQSVADRVRQGNSLAAAVDNPDPRVPVPASFRESVAMGEHLGRLEESLAWAGERFTLDVANRVTWLFNWAQTGSILLIGYLVLSIVLGVLGTMADIAWALSM